MRQRSAFARYLEDSELHSELDFLRAEGEGRKMQPGRAARVQHPQHQELVTEFPQLLEQILGTRKYDHWFRNKVNFHSDGEAVTIGVSSSFLLNWMQREFTVATRQAAEQLFGQAAEVRFEVDTTIAFEQPETTETEQATVDHPAAEQDNQSTVTSARRKQAVTTNESSPVARGRRFAGLDTFVVGPGSELARTAIERMCESPGTQFNPLFLYGGVGLGKTHLLEGIYRRIRAQYPSLNVLFLTAEDFTNYFTQALRAHTLPSFRQRFRGVDLLLVDDIDFLNGKQKIQEEFLHTFKQLSSHGRQMVFTANSHPRLLTKLSDELTTRFLSGMACRVEPPNLATRFQIAEQKVTELNAPIATSAIEYVATHFSNNVRELEGAVNMLATYATLTEKRVGLAAARRVLADLERDCTKLIRMSDVEQVVCEFFGVEAADLKSARRNRTVSQPRMLAMFLARKLTGAAYNEIGNYFGGRNHSTVMSAERKVQSWIKNHQELQIASHIWDAENIIEQLEHNLRAS